MAHAQGFIGWRWLAMLAVLGGVASADPISFTKVVHSTDLLPGLQFNDFAAPSYNDAGQVGFFGRYDSLTQQGIFRWTNGVGVEAVATTTGPFSHFGEGLTTINSGGYVSFYANVGGDGGAWFGTPGSTTNVATEGQVIDGNTVVTVGSAVAINDSNDVGYRGLSTAGQIFYVHAGGGAAGVGQLGTSDGFQGFQPYFDFNNNGDIGLWARHLNGYNGNYLQDGGGIHEVASGQFTTSPLPYTAIGLRPALNNLGVMAVYAEHVPWGAAPAGIYTVGAGGSPTLVSAVTARPKGDMLTINDSGDVAWVDSATETLYLAQNGVVTALLQPGDVLPEGVVQRIDINTNSLNSLGHLAIYAQFTDRERGLYVFGGAPPIPEPGTWALLCGGLLLLRRRRRG